ncbi:hypothetical protein [Lacinutrix salivirga]
MKWVIAITLLICGLILFFENKSRGVLLIVTGIIIYFFKKGIEILIENKTYRNFFSFFGFRIGKLENLPKIEYVSIFNTREYTLDPALRVDAEPGVSKTYDIIHVNLFYNTNQKITAFRTKSKKEAFKVAKEMANRLNIDILDATEPKSKWL